MLPDKHWLWIYMRGWIASNQITDAAPHFASVPVTPPADGKLQTAGINMKSNLLPAVLTSSCRASQEMGSNKHFPPCFGTWRAISKCAKCLRKPHLTVYCFAFHKAIVTRVSVAHVRENRSGMLICYTVTCLSVLDTLVFPVRSADDTMVSFGPRLPCPALTHTRAANR